MNSPNKQVAGMAQPSQIPSQPSSLVNPFSPQDQAAMAGAYGGVQAPGALFRMEDNSPLDQNAFFASLQDAKKSGAKTFNVGDKTFPVK
jgi:hypothetical protein